MKERAKSPGEGGRELERKRRIEIWRNFLCMLVRESGVIKMLIMFVIFRLCYRRLAETLRLTGTSNYVFLSSSFFLL